MEKKNKKLKKLDEGYSQILLKDIRSTMKLMAEQHATTNKRLERIEIKVEKIDTLERDVAIIKSVVQSHSKDIKEIKSDVAILKCDVSELKSDVKILKSDVSILKSDVSILKSDVVILKSDVSVLKSDVSELKSDVKRIDQKLDTHIEIDDKRFQKIEEKVFI